MTALGLVTLRRAYFRCPGCGLGEYTLDEPLGLDGLLSKQARRLVSLAATQQSFARAAAVLEELCGWSISDEAIRRARYREADAVGQWQERHEAAYQAFVNAPGRIELQVDAGKVNTLEGWRDMKIAIYAKREAGPPATPAEWGTRVLPQPRARVAFARVEGAEAFGLRLADWTGRLRVDTSQVSVLGDGAEWIWNLADEHVAGAKQILDVYHGCERLATAGRRLHGEGTAAFDAWLAEARGRLLADGWGGVCEQAGRALAGPLGEAAREPVEEMLGYFSKHTHRLNYCARLYAGQAIGSGMVEGACKNVIGKRLKQTAARWRLENVQKMAVLCCCSYSDTWALYWTAA